jgi:hypothetical protein
MGLFNYEITTSTQGAVLSIPLYKVVLLAVMVIVHPPNLGLIKEDFRRMSQPNFG